MSTYTKDKNIVIFSIDGMSGDYRLDINTGIFCGVKGSPIKTNPKKSTMSRLMYDHRREGNNPNLCYALYRMFDQFTETAAYKRRVDALKAADKLDALGYGGLMLRSEQYAYLGDNIKLLNLYRDTFGMDEFTLQTFEDWVEYEKIKKTLTASASALNAKMYHRIIKRLANPTMKELEVCAYYLVKSKLWEYHCESVDKVVEYVQYCRNLGKTPDKVNNFPREYVETKEAWEAYKIEYNKEIMRKNYSRCADAWSFAYGDYIVTIPTCSQDIVTEGQLQHHCVGRYVENVVNGEFYICFVRHKDNPDKPYITCQVYPSGRIGQYYRAYNCTPYEDYEVEFKAAFAKHLSEVFSTIAE